MADNAYMSNICIYKGISLCKCPCVIVGLPLKSLVMGIKWWCSSEDLFHPCLLMEHRNKQDVNSEGHGNWFHHSQVQLPFKRTSDTVNQALQTHIKQNKQTKKWHKKPSFHNQVYSSHPLELRWTEWGS